LCTPTPPLGTTLRYSPPLQQLLVGSTKFRNRTFNRKTDKRNFQSALISPERSQHTVLFAIETHSFSRDDVMRKNISMP